MMKAIVFVYDTVAIFEVSLSCMFLKYSGDVATAGLEIRDYESYEGLRLRPHHLLEDLDMDDFDCFIVPGGRPETILGNNLLSRKLRQMHAKGGVVAAICGGPVHLAKAGLLKERRYTTTLHGEMSNEFCEGTYVDEIVVADGNIITAKPQGNIDMAFAILDQLELWESPEERAETWRQYHQFLLK
ncbi:MAG: DJ-1/PfpI family protein [Methanomassiliicoccales archaeon]